jgi:hypothetical protein
MSYNAQMYSSAGQQPTVWGNNAGIPEDISLQAIENPKAPDVKGDPMTQVLKTGASMVADYYAPGSGQLVSAALSNVGGGGPGQFVAGQTKMGDGNQQQGEQQSGQQPNAPLMKHVDDGVKKLGGILSGFFNDDEPKPIGPLALNNNQGGFYAS